MNVSGENRLPWFDSLPLPCVCVVCGTALFKNISLCDYCETRLPWIIEKCRRCGLPFNGSQHSHTICGRCIISPPVFRSCKTLFVYETPVNKLITRFKYSAHFADGLVLSTLLAKAFLCYLNELKRSPDLHSLPQQLIPVPLHAGRLRERGFNQASEVARTLSRFSGIEVNNTFVYRSRNTSSQSQLKADDRSNNLKGAFKLQEPVRPLNLNHVVVVDDVVTTMATANALAGLLKSSGVERVDIWAIARASLHP